MRPAGAMPARLATNPNAWPTLRASGRTCGRLACGRKWLKQAPKTAPSDLPATSTNRISRWNVKWDGAHTFLDAEKFMTEPSKGGTVGEPQVASESVWPSPPARLDMAGDQIHVWCAGL